MWLIVTAVYLYKVLLPLYHEAKETKIEITLVVTQMVFLVVSLQNIYVQSKRFEMGTPVSLVYQAIAWIIAGIRSIYIIHREIIFSTRIFGANYNNNKLI